jgi:hypothetical protein
MARMFRILCIALSSLLALFSLIAEFALRDAVLHPATLFGVRD